MKFLDYFFYLTYLFFNRKMGRNEEDAKWSSLLHTTVFSTFTIDTIIYCIGLIVRCKVIELYSSLDFYALLILAFFIFIFFYIRFYKYYNVLKLENQYNNISDKNKKAIQISVITIMIVIPILWFFIKRLYHYNHF